MGDRPRLLTQATKAFVDRAPIDWTALLSRMGVSPERGLVENLRLVAWLRDSDRPETEREPGLLAWLAARLVILAAALQIAASLPVLALATGAGDAATNRSGQMLLAVAFAIATAPLAIAGRREPRGVLLVATFASASSAFIRSALTGLPAHAPVAAWILQGICLEAFTPACLWQFASVFPRVPRFTPFDRLAHRMTVAAWMLGLVLFAVNLSSAYALVDPGPAAALVRHHPSRLFWQLFACALVPAVGTIFVRSRRAPAAERRKVARFACALAGGTAPFLASGIVWSVWPRVSPWLPNVSFDPTWIDRIVVGALTAMPILSTAAVTVDGRLELGAALRHRLASAHRGWRATVERFCLRGPAGRSQQLALALDRLRLARGTREIAATLSRELRRIARARTVHVLVADRGAYADSSGATAPLPASTVLPAMLRESETPLDVSVEGTLHALLPAADRDWVTANDVALVAPIARRDGSVAAVAALGRKRGRFPYDSEDRWLVASLTTAAAAARDSQNASRAGELAFQCSRCGLVTGSTRVACECGAALVLASIPIGLAGKFRVVRQLGAGGMGVVYLAHDRTLDRHVALKTLPRVARKSVSRLRAEARAMAALSHPGLATIYGLELWRYTPVLVVEFFPKGTLAQAIATGPLAPADVVRLGIGLATALDYVHACRMLHGDLKPSNVGLTAAGTAKLLDFGLARFGAEGPDDAVDDRPLVPGPIAGTPAYLPPEALDGGLPSPAFDLWALAVTLLEAVTGANPFASNDRRSFDAIDAQALFSRHLVRVSGLGPYFERSLHPEPHRRFQSAAAVRSALEELAAASEH